MQLDEGMNFLKFYGIRGANQKFRDSTNNLHFSLNFYCYRLLCYNWK